jgi:hypothetical protein
MQSEVGSVSCQLRVTVCCLTSAHYTEHGVECARLWQPGTRPHVKHSPGARRGKRTSVGYSAYGDRRVFLRLRHMEARFLPLSVESRAGRTVVRRKDHTHVVSNPRCCGISRWRGTTGWPVPIALEPCQMGQNTQAAHQRRHSRGDPLVRHDDRPASHSCCILLKRDGHLNERYRKEKYAASGGKSFRGRRMHSRQAGPASRSKRGTDAARRMKAGRA